MIAPFPPTPCRVWLDRDGTPAVDDDKELLVEVIERAYPSAALATLVPRAQWEAAERVGKALRAYEAFDDYSYEKSPNRCDDFCAACDEYEAALAHFATFFPEVP